MRKNPKVNATSATSATSVDRKRRMRAAGALAILPFQMAAAKVATASSHQIQAPPDATRVGGGTGHW